MKNPFKLDLSCRNWRVALRQPGPKLVGATHGRRLDGPVGPLKTTTILENL